MVGWKFYLCFIILGCLSSMVFWFFFPHIKLALEELAATFGDQDEMAIYDGEMRTDLKKATVKREV